MGLLSQTELGRPNGTTYYIHGNVSFPTAVMFSNDTTKPGKLTPACHCLHASSLDGRLMAAAHSSIRPTQQLQAFRSVKHCVVYAVGYINLVVSDAVLNCVSDTAANTSTAESDNKGGPASSSSQGALPGWAWALVAVGACALLAVAVLAVVLARSRHRQRHSSLKPKMTPSWGPSISNSPVGQLGAGASAGNGADSIPTTCQASSMVCLLVCRVLYVHAVLHAALHFLNKAQMLPHVCPATEHGPTPVIGMCYSSTGHNLHTARTAQHGTSRTLGVVYSM